MSLVSRLCMSASADWVADEPIAGTALTLVRNVPQAHNLDLSYRLRCGCRFTAARSAMALSASRRNSVRTSCNSVLLTLKFIAARDEFRPSRR